MMALHVEQSHWRLFTGVSVAFGISSTEAIVAWKRWAVEDGRSLIWQKLLVLKDWTILAGRIPLEMARGCG